MDFSATDLFVITEIFCSKELVDFGAKQCQCMDCSIHTKLTKKHRYFGQRRRCSATTTESDGEYGISLVRSHYLSVFEVLTFTPSTIFFYFILFYSRVYTPYRRVHAECN